MSKIDKLRPVKHIPLRTCLACREVKARQELIRLVRLPEGSVEIDEVGRKAGRGAYICRSRQCWENGLKGSRLEHTLRTTITTDNRKELIELSRGLLKEIEE